MPGSGRRFKKTGAAGLYDRSSRPHAQPCATPSDKRERIVNLCSNQRLPYVEIARRVGISAATVGRICQGAGLAQLAAIDAPSPKLRYERKTPGEILHMDTKKLACFTRPGHRVTGDVSRHSKKPGYHALHVAIDDHSRVGFSLILPDETVQSVVSFTFAALRYYKTLGVHITRIMTDNGSAYRSKKFARLLRHLKIRHLRTRPYTPRTNGKTERFIRRI